MARYSQTLMGQAQLQAGKAAHFFRNMLPEGALRQRVDNLATRRSPVDTWLQAHGVFDYRTAHRLSGIDESPGGQEAQFVAVLDGINPNWRQESPVGLSCLLDTRVYMINQLLRDADAASMAHSLELRVPLVDLEVMGFSRTCDDQFKLSQSGGKGGEYQSSGAKRVLIHALRDVLPPDIAERRKRGFELPFNSWLQGPLAPLVEDTCSRQSVRSRDLLDPDLVQEILAGAAPGGQKPFPKVWSLLVLELWCRAVLDAPVARTDSISTVASV